MFSGPPLLFLLLLSSASPGASLVVPTREVLSGASITVSCSAPRLPTSSGTRWFYNATSGVEVDGRDNGRLTIANVSSQHSGTYKCSRLYYNRQVFR